MICFATMLAIIMHPYLICFATMLTIIIHSYYDLFCYNVSHYNAPLL